jgi:phospholipid/cholesterol/gamma-HCH transport system permease protein
MSSPPLISRRVDGFLASVHDFTSFGMSCLGALRHPPPAREIVRQCYEVGVRTLPLVTLTGVITGIVFTQQSRPSLAAFGATSWLPSLVTLALVRSLAPLVTALICAGKVGSSIGAELGSMKVTEQIEAMAVSAVDPVRFLALSRTIATTLMVPVLTMYFGFVGFLGSYFNVRAAEGITWTAFVHTGFQSLGWLDAWSALARAVIYGLTIGLVASWHGFRATRGTRGVGRAANLAVVQSMLLVFVEEILVVQVINLLRAAGW